MPVFVQDLETKGASAKQLGDFVPSSTFAKSIMTNLFAQQVTSSTILCWLGAMVSLISFGLALHLKDLKIGVLPVGMLVIGVAYPSPKQPKSGVAKKHGEYVTTKTIIFQNAPKASANAVLVLGRNSKPTEASKPICSASGKKKKGPPPAALKRTVFNVHTDLCAVGILFCMCVCVHLCACVYMYCVLLMCVSAWAFFIDPCTHLCGSGQFCGFARCFTQTVPPPPLYPSSSRLLVWY